DAIVAALSLVDVQADGEANQRFLSEFAVVDCRWTRVATSEGRGRIRVQPYTGEGESRDYVGPEEQPYTMRFSPDARWFCALYHHAGVIHLWELEGKRHYEVPMGTGQFDLDDEQMVVGEPFQLRVYDLRTGEWSSRVPLTRPPNLLRLSPSGRHVAVAYFTMPVVQIVDLHREVVDTTVFLSQACNDIAFTEDGRSMATASSRGELEVWDVETGERVHRVGVHERAATDIAFAPDGQQLISLGTDGTMRVWDVHRESEALRSLVGVASGFEEKREFLVGPAGRMVVQGALRSPWFGRLIRGTVHRTSDPLDEIRVLAVHPDGRLLVSGSSAGLEFWDAASGERLSILPSSAVSGLAIDGSGSLWVCTADGIHRWPVVVEEGARCVVHVGPPERLLEVGAEHIGRIAVGRLGHWAVGMGNHFSLTRVDLRESDRDADPRPLWHFGVMRLAFSRSGRWLASAAWRGNEVRVWDVTADRPPHILTGGTLFRDLVFSPDDRWLAVSRQGRYELYDATNGALARTFERTDLGGGSGPLCFTPDARVMAYSDVGLAIQLVDPESGRELVRLTRSGSQSASAMEFARGGRVLVSAGRRIEFWDLGELRERITELGLELPVAFGAPSTGESPESEAELAVELDLGDLEDARRWSSVYPREVYSASLTRIDRRLEEADGEAQLELRRRRIRLLQHLGRHLDALDELARLSEEPPDPQHHLELRGCILDSLGRRDEALVDLNAALALDSELLEARYRRGLLRAQRAEYAAAIEDFRGVIERSPESLGAINDLAWLLATAPWEYRDLDEADRLSERLLGGRGGSVPAYLRTRALIEYRMGHARAALALLEHSIGLEGADGDGVGVALAIRVLCELAVGEVDRARESYVSALFQDRWTEWAHRAEIIEPLVEEARLLFERSRGASAHHDSEVHGDGVGQAGHEESGTDDH
ncbi:MAG: hypothetical protein KDC38_04370, partial [Planctomycetes bacterium]|nr:hypothetical protein [Planctomycetota bacterium]